jgi:hypothetical protein
VQVEARQTDGKRQWHVAFARLSAAEVTVRTGERQIWKVEAASDKDPLASYYADNR